MPRPQTLRSRACASPAAASPVTTSGHGCWRTGAWKAGPEFSFHKVLPGVLFTCLFWLGFCLDDFWCSGFVAGFLGQNVLMHVAEVSEVSDVMVTWISGMTGGQIIDIPMQLFFVYTAVEKQ